MTTPPDVGAIMDAITRALPGWRFVGGPQPFTSAPDRHLRACLASGDQTEAVVIRRAWRDEGYEVETFLYRHVLPRLSLRTPRLWATFVLDADGSKWTVLEDLGVSTAQRNREADRRAVLRALGCLHGEGAAFLDDVRGAACPLPRFGPGVVPYAGRLVPVERWHEILDGALRSPSFRPEAWVHPFLDALLRRLAGEPATLLHGDANFSNAVLTGDGVGLIDFERAFIGPASLDIGRVAAMTESPGELDDYRRGFAGTTEAGPSPDAVADWAELGQVYDGYYWICYYVEETLRGRDLGEDMRTTLYDRMYVRLQALHHKRRDLSQTS